MRGSGWCVRFRTRADSFILVCDWKLMGILWHLGCILSLQVDTFFAPESAYIYKRDLFGRAINHNKVTRLDNGRVLCFMTFTLTIRVPGVICRGLKIKPHKLFCLRPQLPLGKDVLAIWTGTRRPGRKMPRKWATMMGSVGSFVKYRRVPGDESATVTRASTSRIYAVVDWSMLTQSYIACLCDPRKVAVGSFHVLLSSKPKPCRTMQGLV